MQFNRIGHAWATEDVFDAAQIMCGGFLIFLIREPSLWNRELIVLLSVLFIFVLSMFWCLFPLVSLVRLWSVIVAHPIIFT